MFAEKKKTVTLRYDWHLNGLFLTVGTNLPYNRKGAINYMNKTSEKQARYDAKATVRVGLKLNRKTDADVIQRLTSVESMQGYIKKLIRQDIEREKTQD